MAEKQIEKPHVEKDSHIEKRTVDGVEIEWDKNLGGPIYKTPAEVKAELAPPKPKPAND